MAVKILRNRKPNSEPYARFRREVDTQRSLSDLPGVLPPSVRLRNGSSQRAVVVVAADRSRARPVGHDLRRGRRWSRRNRQRHRASRLGDGLHRSRHALRQPAEWLSKSKSANSIQMCIRDSAGFTWHVESAQISDPCLVAFNIVSPRAYHREAGPLTVDDQCSFTYRVLPDR